MCAITLCLYRMFKIMGKYTVTEQMQLCLKRNCDLVPNAGICRSDSTQCPQTTGEFLTAVCYSVLFIESK